MADRSTPRLVALLVVPLLMLAACAPAATPAPKPAAPAPAAPVAPAAKPALPAPAAPAAAPEKQPKYGGIFVTYINLGSSLSLDPFTAGGQTTALLAPMYNGLVRFDFVDTKKIIPDLAERWEVSPDGLTYTFYLRKDVKWQDGKPFGAWDVQFTYDRALDSKQLAQSGWGKDILKLVDSWKTVDDYTFQIKLKNPVIYFMYFLGSTSSTIAPKHMFDKEAGTVLAKEGEFQWGVGTGPFRVVKFEIGASVDLVKNPSFFRKGLPYLDGVKRLIINERATQVAAMASGRVMVGNQWLAQLPSEIKLIQEGSGGKMHIVPSYQNQAQAIRFQSGFPPMDNPKVRRAIFLAIDRWDIAERVYEGTGEAGTILDSRIYGDWALPKEEVSKVPGLRKDKVQDIAEAKRLLAEVGYPNGFEAIWQVRNTGEYVVTAQVVAAQLEKIGIKSKIESLDTTAGARIIAQGKWQLGSGPASVGVGYHALSSMKSFVQASTYANFNVQWTDSNKEFVDLYQKALTSLDLVEARRLTLEMQRYLLTKDAEFFPVVWIDAPMIVWNQVKNYYAPYYGITQGTDYTIVWLDQ